jgi:hypothetical protein
MMHRLPSLGLVYDTWWDLASFFGSLCTHNHLNWAWIHCRWWPAQAWVISYYPIW